MKHQLKTLPTSKSSNPKRAQPFEAERRSLRAAANKRPIPSPLEDTGGQLAGGRGVLSPVSYCNLPESRTCPSCLPPSARQQQVSSSLQSLPITRTVSQELLFTDSECYESASLPAICQCSSQGLLCTPAAEATLGVKARQKYVQCLTTMRPRVGINHSHVTSVINNCCHFCFSQTDKKHSQ